MRIEPAELSYDGEGTPYSSTYADIYHSAESGPGQARHVFIAGNDLPRRWAHARTYTVLETGFGLGLNFLATWQAWREDPARCEQLHYVSIEKHPFSREALAALHRRYSQFAALAAELQAVWPLPLAGMHRLHFENERITLTLAFGDAAALAPKLRLRADAIYLDGFAPKLNPEMWSPELMRELARLARSGTSFATYSSAAPVRQALEAAGFAVEKCAGFGRKREMLRGSYAPQRAQAPKLAHGERHAIVIGSGIAGAAVVERLARRGWQIDLIESRVLDPAQPMPKYAGVFHPHVSRDDSILSRAARNGFLYALTRWLALERAGGALHWARCGVLQLANEDGREAQMRAAIATQGFPAEFAGYLDRDQAKRLAGSAVGAGGWWFPGGGWIRPLSLIPAQLAAAGTALRAHFGVRVERIARADDRWHARAADGKLIASAPVLVLANSNDMARLAGVGQALQQVRGQVSYLPETALQAPQVVLCGAGYVLPATEGTVVTGSTYDRGNDDPEPQTQGHAANLQRLAQLLPQVRVSADATTMEGAVGFRCVAPDRLPLVGAMPDLDAARALDLRRSGGQLEGLPRQAGLYCTSAFASRGLIWAALAAETLASMLEEEPLPLEGDLVNALDPGRFLLRQARRGTI